MRVALNAVGSRGDVYPLLALGDALVAHGHEVIACVPRDFREHVESRGMEFRFGGLDARELLQQNAAAVTRGGLRMLRLQLRLTGDLLSATFEHLPEAARGADLLIGGGVAVAAASVAELHGVPYRYASYCPALLPSQEHSPGLFPFQSRRPGLNRALWRWAVPSLFRSMRGRLNRQRARLGLAPVPDVLAHFFGTAPVLMAADAELAPVPPDCPVEHAVIGALQADVEGELPPKLATFLEAGPPPVYVGFGSMTDPDAAGTTRAILASVERLGCRALLSAGWAGLGDVPLPDGVMCIGAVSHARLFPRVAAVVHHGGAGATTTAARAGVPQVIVPHLMDQHYWSRRVEALGLGPPPLARRRLAADRLRDALAETLDNELLAERARDLGARLRARDPMRPENREAMLARVLTVDRPRAGGATSPGGAPRR